MTMSLIFSITNDNKNFRECILIQIFSYLHTQNDKRLIWLGGCF